MTTRLIALSLLLSPCFVFSQLTVQRGAGVFLSENSELAIQGDVSSNDDIEGDGKVLLTGDRTQSVSFNNHRLPRVFVEKTTNVLLSSDLTIDKELVLKTGHLQCDLFTLTLGGNANALGNQKSFVQTGNYGKVIKLLNKDEQDYLLPVGGDQGYMPLMLKSNGKYFNASIEVTANLNPSRNKPVASKNFLNNYWTVTRTGISGKLLATAFYHEVNGDDDDVAPYYWNGFKWENTNADIDVQKKTITIPVPEGNGEIYAMSNVSGLVTQNEVTLLPNPVKAVATLVIESADAKNAEIKLIDNKGSALSTQKVTLLKGINQIKIDVARFANGAYNVIISSEKNQRSLQLIKN